MHFLILLLLGYRVRLTAYTEVGSPVVTRPAAPFTARPSRRSPSRAGLIAPVRFRACSRARYAFFFVICLARPRATRSAAVTAALQPSSHIATFDTVFQGEVALCVATFCLSVRVLFLELLRQRRLLFIKSLSERCELLLLLVQKLLVNRWILCPV